MLYFTHSGLSFWAVFELTGGIFLDQESHLTTLQKLPGGSTPFYCEGSLGIGAD